VPQLNHKFDVPADEVERAMQKMEPSYIIQANIRHYESLLTRASMPEATLRTVRLLLREARANLAAQQSHAGGRDPTDGPVKTKRGAS
jgi:hypothetical protein